MPAPYYQDDLVTLYLGDCLDPESTLTAPTHLLLDYAAWRLPARQAAHGAGDQR